MLDEALLIAAEKFNVMPIWLSARAEFTRIDLVPPPPAFCRAFVLLPARLDPGADQPHAQAAQR